MNKEELIKKAQEHFAKLIEEQIERVEKIKKDTEWTDFTKLDKIRIGFAGGDGIGPIISRETRRVIEYLLADEIKSGRIELVDIEGLTIENRFKHMKAVPDDVLEQIKTCHVFLKGPTETPQAGDPRGNIESANVYLRRALDLFANVRPVKIPQEGIDWTFFRENTEGAYILGSKGIMATDEIAFDFKVITRPGAERIIKMAFDYAKKNGKTRVSGVHKANVIKTTDGLFSLVFREIAKEYPEITADEWYIDIMTAKLIDPQRRKQFQVIVLPNLYGDIITDEAAQIQGGVGTAGSANIGRHYAMFEAIHGSGTRMVKEGRAEYADPSSLMRAAVLMLEHIGFNEKAKKLEMALDICGVFEKKLVVTGRPTGASAKEYTDYILETLKSPDLEAKWKEYYEKALQGK